MKLNYKKFNVDQYKEYWAIDQLNHGTVEFQHNLEISIENIAKFPSESDFLSNRQM